MGGTKGIMNIKPFKGEVYFHVLGPDRMFGQATPRREALPGKTYHATKPNAPMYDDVMYAYHHKQPTQCVWGMHASNGLFYDANYGNWICLVRLWGSVYHEPSKSVALRRKVIAMRQWKRVVCATSCYRLQWRGNDDGHGLSTGPGLQDLADWILEDPFMGIVSP